MWVVWRCVQCVRVFVEWYGVVGARVVWRDGCQGVWRYVCVIYVRGCVVWYEVVGVRVCGNICV